MLVSGKQLLNEAKAEGYAVAAFGFVNLEGAKAIVLAAELCHSPVILQTTVGGIKYGGLEQLYSIAKACANEVSVPVAIHLDHAHQFAMIEDAIEIGYTSVMYDGSELPISENCKNSKRVKTLVAEKNISLEVEVGIIGGKEDDLENEQVSAKIEDIKLIADTVNPDAIAIAVGTQHGIYKDEVKINYELIKEAKLKTNSAIVIHGASGLSEADIKQCVAAGANKINFDTELKQSLIDGIMSYMQKHPQAYDIRKIMQPGIDKQVELIKKRIIQCGSIDKG